VRCQLAAGRRCPDGGGLGRLVLAGRPPRGVSREQPGTSSRGCAAAVTFPALWG
jgi:hypothetical protein